MKVKSGFNGAPSNRGSKMFKLSMADAAAKPTATMRTLKVALPKLG